VRGRAAGVTMANDVGLPKIPYIVASLQPVSRQIPDCTKIKALAMSGTLGKTKGGLEIKCHYFPGTGDESALIISGVHGYELSGIEVTELLVERLKNEPKPFYTVIIIPELFPDNAARARKANPGPGSDSNVGRYTRGKTIDPNRQFPKPGERFDPDKTRDAEGRQIEYENQLLMQLIECFKPCRIASVHAKRYRSMVKKGVNAPGIYVDPRGGFDKTATKTKEGKEDDALALAMARKAKRKGARVPGNFLDPKDAPPVVHFAGSAPTQKGVSLGEWGPLDVKGRKGMTVITVEIQHFYSTDAKRKPKNPETSENVKKRPEELKAHCDALRDVFLTPIPIKKVGVNYPWSSERKSGNSMYGWDFGESPPGWRKPDWQKDVRNDIIDLKNLGIFAIRWFILADGLTYGTYDDAPHLDTDPTRKGQWRFDNPPQLTGRYKKIEEDFGWMLKCLSDLDMKIIPSLIDFHWCWPGECSDKNSPDQNTGKCNSNFVKRGRSDVINDYSPNKAKQKQFFKNVLEPLLDKSIDYKNTIYAWELINEPEGATIGYAGKNEKPTVPLGKMLDFIENGIKIINGKGFESTIGYRRSQTLMNWKKPNSSYLGVKLHQFHYNPIPRSDPNSGRIPSYRNIPNPCIIGEFATTQNEYPKDYIYHWPDLSKTDQSVYSRLKLIESKNYPCAFLWSMNAGKSASDWSQPTKDSILKYAIHK
jgi:hypothetical protein